MQYAIQDEHSDSVFVPIDITVVTIEK